MVAIKVIHFMKTKTKGNDGYVALRLDTDNAYGQMDWDYLKEVMTKMRVLVSSEPIGCLCVWNQLIIEASSWFLMMLSCLSILCFKFGLVFLFTLLV